MNEEKKRLKQNQKITRNNPQLKSIKDQIEQTEKLTDLSLYGIDREFYEKEKNDLAKIKNSIQRVGSHNKEVTGDGIIEFLTASQYENHKKANSSTPNKSTKENFNGILNSAQLGTINEIYAREKDRISLYYDYEGLVQYIPQLSQAINVFRDNIISPDDFTKDIFSAIYQSDDIDSDKTDEIISSNIKKLNDLYGIEDKSSEWIKEVLIDGDKFVATIPIDEEFNKMVNEDGKLMLEGNNLINEFSSNINLLNEDTIKITDNEINSLNSFFNESLEDNKDESKINWKKELSDYINEHVTYSENKFSLVKDQLILESDFKTYRNSFSAQGTDIESKESPNQDGLMSSKQSSSGIIINGSYLKEMDCKRTIKIQIGETCYGYFYIESTDRNIEALGMSNPRNVFSTLTLRQTVDISSNSTTLDDPKKRLIVDLFTRNIASKINKKFIADNKEFKNVIYNLMKEDFLLKNNIQIIFIKPEHVHHLVVKKGKDGYGVSILKDIVFTAKLYLSILTCNLMMKLTRSQDHRSFYIETGLSEDIEGTINAFIRDIKTKEVKMADTQSLDTIFNSIGTFTDYYLPTVNGERPVEIDTIPGMNVDVDNDFLDYLRKAIISGLGIPNSFLSYADEMEFARSVSMVNGMFLRSIITMQKSLSPKFSNIYRSLYKNEYDYGNNKSSNNVNNIVVNYDKILAVFPPPSTLNLTNISDQISVVQGVLDVLSAFYFQDSSDDPNVEVKKLLFKKTVGRKYAPNIDWDELDDIFNSLDSKVIEENLKKDEKIEPETDDTDSSSSDDMMGY